VFGNFIFTYYVKQREDFMRYPRATLRYTIGDHIAEFYTGKILVLRKEIRTCPLCKEQFVTVKLSEGIAKMYGDQIRMTLIKHKVKPASTSQCCEDCTEEWLARTSILEEVLGG